MDEAEMVRNRMETPGDEPFIRSVHKTVFGTSAEADLVDKLREDGDLLSSLVSTTNNGEIVGHSAFFKIDCKDHRNTLFAGLGPIAVMEDYRGHGIGGRMVRAGLNGLEKREIKMVFVLGDPEYYERFGFSRQTAKPFTCTFDSEDFLAIEIGAGVPEPAQGELIFPRAFSDFNA